MVEELASGSVMVESAGRGAFKFRGACNAVLSLPQEQAEKGVITHSSGNHAGALALAAKARGIPCTVITPQGTPKCKLDAIRCPSQLTLLRLLPKVIMPRATCVQHVQQAVLKMTFNAQACSLPCISRFMYIRTASCGMARLLPHLRDLPGICLAHAPG